MRTIEHVNNQAKSYHCKAVLMGLYCVYIMYMWTVCAIFDLHELGR